MMERQSVIKSVSSDYNNTISSKLYEPVFHKSDKNQIEDDDQWHDKQFNRKIYIQSKIEQYMAAFTVHGLTRVFIGERIESIFWLVILFGGTILTVSTVHGLVAKYLRFGVFTEIRSEVTDENYLPSITFCEYQMFVSNYFSYCGVPTFSRRDLYNDSSKPCKHVHKEAIVNVTSKRDFHWSNGLFNITKCETWDRKRCANGDYFKPIEYFGQQCIRFNYAGNLSDIYSHVDLEFEFNMSTWHHGKQGEELIIAIPHDHRIHEIDLTKRIGIEPNKVYEIKLDKTEINRLPAPFPSKCSNSKGYDIFPGRYTRHSCIESHNFIENYKKCGDTLDYVRQFIPPDIKRKYKGNKTIDEALKCIKQLGKQHVKINDICAFPCTELDLTFMHTFKEQKNKGGKNQTQPKYSIGIQYQRVDAYRIMEEKELYSWDQLACEIGGFLGLIIGASILSMIEILLYICLSIVNRFL